MADRYNPQFRKYCKFCNCWYANNKLSIDAHEKGTTHQSNVDKELVRSRKDKNDLAQAEKIYKQMMDKIEAVAFKAFEEDAKHNPFAKDELDRYYEARNKQCS